MATKTQPRARTVQAPTRSPRTRATALVAKRPATTTPTEPKTVSWEVYEAVAQRSMKREHAIIEARALVWSLSHALNEAGGTSEAMGAAVTIAGCLEGILDGAEEG